MTNKSSLKDSQDLKLLLKIGVLIRKLRLEKRLTQNDLAAKSNMALSQISRMEQGKVNFRLSQLKRIASAFRCDLGNLLP